MWIEALAKRINANKNIKSIGNGVGIVISTSPMKISYAGGNTILDTKLKISQVVKQKITSGEIVAGDSVIIINNNNKDFYVVDKVG